MRVAIAVLLIVGLSVLLLFVAMNSGETVRVNLFNLRQPPEAYPVSLVVLVSGMMGVLFASVIGIVEGTRLRLHNHQLRGRVKRLEAEIQEIRARALEGRPLDERVDEESTL